METTAHQRLKRLGARFLLELGCQAVGIEVRCPRSRYRADIAGYLDSRPVYPDAADERRALSGTLWGESIHARELSRQFRCEPRAVIVECKQSRSDFLRDSRESEGLIARRERLESRRIELEDSHIKNSEPHLRESDTYLFNELESWDFSSSRSGAYRRVLRELRRIERQLHGETKFWLAARYRLADRLYILSPAGMVERRELPPGWGLIECSPSALHRARFDVENANDLLRVVVSAPEQSCGRDQRQRLLRNIAIAATRECLGRAPLNPADS